MSQQKEWKIRKDLELVFPNCDKGLELLCQSTVFIKGIRYREVLLKLSTTNHTLIKTFLQEVSKNQVKINDKTWKSRFENLISDNGTSKLVERKPKSENDKITELLKRVQAANKKKAVKEEEVKEEEVKEEEVKEEEKEEEVKEEEVKEEEVKEEEVKEEEVKEEEVKEEEVKEEEVKEEEEEVIEDSSSDSVEEGDDFVL